MKGLPPPAPPVQGGVRGGSWKGKREKLEIKKRWLRVAGI